MTTVVVDVGCCEWNGEGSIERLIERYEPMFLYGFDPLLSEDEISYDLGDTFVYLERKAAWTEEGILPLGVGGHTYLDATLLTDKADHGEWNESRRVEVFDFGGWLYDLDETPVLKLNVEGAEFPLLEDLCNRDLDHLIELLHVAWHDDRMGGDYPERRRALEERLRCPVEPWVLW